MDKMLINAFDCFSLEEVVQIAPKELSFELSADTLQRLQDKAVEKLRVGGNTAEIHSVRSGGKSRRLMKALLIAAIIAALLAAGALAAWLCGSRFFSQALDSASYDIIRDYVMSDIAEASDGTWKLTLESALADGHYYFAVFSVERLDGGSVSGFLPNVDFEFTLENPSRLKPASQYEKLDTPENSDSRIYCLATIRSEQKIVSLKMTLKGMYSATDGHHEQETEISLESAFRSCPLARGGDNEGVFRNIELSPFGLWIDVFEPWEGSDALSEGVPVHEVSIKLVGGGSIGEKAGQNVDSESIGLSLTQRPNGTHQSVIIGTFTPFIDTGTVEAVVIDGIEYPVILDLE